MKLEVELGVTLCVDFEKRNFLRFGVKALDIDTDLDIEEQARTALGASIKVSEILNEGLQETLEVFASELNGVPTSLHDDITSVKREILKIEEKLIPNVVDKVKELAKQLGEGKETSE